MRFDPMNRRILSALQRDARATYREIAEELNRSESTVRDRIMKLEREGAIRGYSVLVDPDILGYSVQAIIRANAEAGQIEFIIKQISAMMNVVRVHHVMGERRLLIHVVAESPRHLQGLTETELIPLGLTELSIDLITGSFEGNFVRPMHPAEARPANGPSVMVVRNKGVR